MADRAISVSCYSSTFDNEVSIEVGDVTEILALRARTKRTTSNIDDTVRVGILGKRLRNHSLTTSESTRYGTSTTQCGRKQRIDHTLSSYKCSLSWQFRCRSGHTNRPEVRHGKLVNLAGHVVSYLQHGIVQRKLLVTVRTCVRVRSTS